MKIFLFADLRVKDIRKEFEKEFPYLKIEFLRKKSPAQPDVSKFETVSPNCKLIDVMGVMKEGEIVINGSETVAELKQSLQSKFNLPIQISPKTCTGRIATTYSDHLTLARQNRIGREACKAMYDEVVL